MSALQPRLTGATVLDLFAGSGALGLEALSRGAGHVTLVERAAAPLRALRANLEKLDVPADAVEVVRRDAIAFVAHLEEGAFDLALADPPYGRGLASRLVERFFLIPFADELWIEHRVSDRLPEIPGARTRRYGDTLLTAIARPHV